MGVNSGASLTVVVHVDDEMLFSSSTREFSVKCDIVGVGIILFSSILDVFLSSTQGAVALLLASK